MTDLLEIVNYLSRAAHQAKELAAQEPDCGCGHQWLNPTFFVYRNGHREVAINFDEKSALKLAFKVAAEMFEADEVGLIMDGNDTRKHNKYGRHTLALAVNRHGEMLWKVEPYLLSGRTPMWLGTEVPDEFPLADPWVAVKMHEVMKRNHKIIPSTFQDECLAYGGPDATPEHVRAVMDCAAGRAIEYGRASKDGISKVSFFAIDGTPRAEVLRNPGIDGAEIGARWT